MPARIGVFLASLEGGGAERSMLNLAHGMRDLGHEVDLILATPAGAYRDEIGQKIHLVDLGASRVLAALPGLVAHLRRRRFEVLFSALDHANLVALWAGCLAGTGVRVIPSIRNTFSEELKAGRGPKARLMLAASRRTYATADQLVAVSDGVAADASKVLRVPRERIVVLPNPVLTPDISIHAMAPVAHRWLQPGAPPVVLACGRLAPQKDYPTLFRAFARLRQSRDLRLVILGEGQERGRLLALAADLGIADSVDLPGFDSNPFRFMARAAVFVLTSRYEGSPNVLVQALACGCPVVAADCRSGPREILAGIPDTQLVPVGDVDGFAAAIGDFLDPEWQRPAPRRLERFDYLHAAAAYLTLVQAITL